MTLAELRPRRTAHYLTFDCPCGSGHKQRIPIKQLGNGCFSWKIRGRLPKVTLIPSVHSHCTHFSILRGEVILSP